MSHAMSTRPSQFSLNAGGSLGRGRPRPSRQCSNCTCSPGLLSRQGRLSSTLNKRISMRRTSGNRGDSPSSLSGSPRRTSLYTVDSECTNDQMNTSLRLEMLRNAMKEYDDSLGVYIIPSEDAHQSEYVSAADQRRYFISGFSGSAGVAVVSRDIMCMNDKPEGLSALSTDGRYFTQASQELDYNWVLLRQGVKNEPTWQEWSAKQAAQMSRDSGREIKIGIDPKLVTFAQVQQFKKVIAEQCKSGANVVLSAIKKNLIDQIWPYLEKAPIRLYEPLSVQDLKHTGMDTATKLAKVKEAMGECDSLVVSSLDEIAWFLNLRGTEVAFNPVFYSYLLINRGKVTLYIDNHERLDNVKAYLDSIDVSISPYEEFWKDLKTVSDASGISLLVPDSASWAIVDCATGGCKQTSSPISELKAVKTPEEIAGAKSAHSKDGLAIINFLAWLQKRLVKDGELVDEVAADDQLLQFRKALPDFKGLSFETISATGANAAIIHYAPKRGECSVIDPSKVYLLDTGSHFLEGTTDTTRTVHFGSPSKEEIENYTAVLKGNIALASLKFPEGTTGLMIDAIARQFLWQKGLDFKHGTGHGVGSFLNVHEGPIGIGFRPYCNVFPLQEGNILSNEPGFYKEGHYGIRLENVMFVKSSEAKFLQFETVTKVPFCRKLINSKLLTQDEKDWLNAYHRQIWDEMSKKVSKEGYYWLKQETAKI